jgi:hypothetical protein
LAGLIYIRTIHRNFSFEPKSPLEKMKEIRDVLPKLEGTRPKQRQEITNTPTLQEMVMRLLCNDKPQGMASPFERNSPQN